MSSLGLWDMVSFQTSGVTSETQTMFVVSIPILLILGWAVAAALLVIGDFKHNYLLVTCGIVSLGVMTMVTPLSFYVYEAVRRGRFEASAFDFLLMALFALLGGMIVGSGVTRFWMKKPA